MMDILERALSPHDQRAEVMKMCLNSSTGEYEPVRVDSEPVNARPISVKSSSKSSSVKVKARVPGKAGGGWESTSSESDEETKAPSKTLQGLQIQ